MPPFPHRAWPFADGEMAERITYSTEGDPVLLRRPLYEVWPEVRESNEARLRPVWRGETIQLKDALYRRPARRLCRRVV